MNMNIFYLIWSKRLKNIDLTFFDSKLLGCQKKKRDRRKNIFSSQISENFWLLIENNSFWFIDLRVMTSFEAQDGTKALIGSFSAKLALLLRKEKKLLIQNVLA